MQYSFQIAVVVLLVVSWARNRDKTLKALRIGLKKFVAVLPVFVTVILLTSVVLGFVSPSTVQRLLGSASNRWVASGIASLVGSVAIMPGFVAFPLGGMLRDNGVQYMVVSAFTTALMMVGVVTFPMEKAFFGTRVALLRNAVGLLLALAVAVLTGLAFAEWHV